MRSILIALEAFYVSEFVLVSENFKEKSIVELNWVLYVGYFFPSKAIENEFVFVRNT